MKTYMLNSAHIQSVDVRRIAAAKIAHTVRRVDQCAMTTLITGDVTPSSGDVVLARVIGLGHHKAVQGIGGRRLSLFVGDEIIVCYGDRYAPDQFEALVPEDLSVCHLVAGGGVASRSLSQHSKLKGPTVIEPLGLLGDDSGRVINIRDWALPSVTPTGPRPLTFAVVGTSMNAGKTTTAAYFIRGLVNSGMKVGAAKVTGTGAPRDTGLMIDAGATVALDFSDAGYPSTYRIGADEVQGIVDTLTNHLHADGVDAIVLEVADGLFQQETAALLKSGVFQRNVDGVLFAAGDAMGASAGADWLRQQALPVLALSGCLSSSPLASAEAERVSGLPVLALEQLSADGILADILEKPARNVVELSA